MNSKLSHGSLKRTAIIDFEQQFFKSSGAKRRAIAAKVTTTDLKILKKVKGHVDLNERPLPLDSINETWYSLKHSNKAEALIKPLFFTYHGRMKPLSLHRLSRNLIRRIGRTTNVHRPVTISLGALFFYYCHERSPTSPYPYRSQSRRPGRSFASEFCQSDLSRRQRKHRASQSL